MARRVAITGVGIVSSLGHSFESVTESLQAGASGVRSVPEWKDLGLRSTVAGALGDLFGPRPQNALFEAIEKSLCHSRAGAERAGLAAICGFHRGTSIVTLCDNSR